MPRKKKVEKPTTIQCPIRGHRHALQLFPHPDRPDLVIARCGKRDVYQASAEPRPESAEPESAAPRYSYQVPKLDAEKEGE